MEQQNVYQALNPSPQAANLTYSLLPSGWWNNSTYFAAAQAKVKSYLCPSDQPELNVNGVFITMYSDATDLTFTGGYYPNPTGNYFGKSNYSSSSGTIGYGSNGFYGQFAGPFTNGSRQQAGFHS